MSSPPAALQPWTRLRTFFGPGAPPLSPLLSSSHARRNSSGLLIHVDAHARPLSSQFNTRRWPSSPRDVYAVLFLLRQVLNADVAREIVDAAGYWVKTATRRSDAIVVGELGGGGPYVVSPPITGGGPRPVRRVVVTIVSHDQGWSGSGEEQGGYGGSWTWFEARVETAEREPPSGQPLVLVWNVHAWGEAWTHTFVLERDGHDEGARWVRALRKGDRIAVVPMAMFPWSTNHVSSVQIEVYTSALR